MDPRNLTPLYFPLPAATTATHPPSTPNAEDASADAVDADAVTHAAPHGTPWFVGPVRVATLPTTKNTEPTTNGRTTPKDLPLLPPSSRSRSRSRTDQYQYHRGLIATRPIAAGELLLVTTPLAAASVATVAAAWHHPQQQRAQSPHEQQTGTSSCSSSTPTPPIIATIAEADLLDACRRCTLRHSHTTTTTHSQGPSAHQQSFSSSSLLMLDCLMAMQGSGTEALPSIRIQQRQQSNSSSSIPTIASSTTFTTSTASNDNPSLSDLERRLMLQPIVVAEQHLHHHQPDNVSSSSPPPPSLALSDEALVQIIRRNAFGPDFTTMETMERQWKTSLYNPQQQQPQLDTQPQPQQWPFRILSLYPLAAMINHSCVPNAVRLYTHTTDSSNSSTIQNEVMIVHACQAIAANEEIVWSYIPLNQPVERRHQQLFETHGFVCACPRCQLEQDPQHSRMEPNDSLASLLDTLSVSPSSVGNATKVVEFMEQDLFLRRRQTTTLVEENQQRPPNFLYSNELKRALRVSHLTHYMDHLNASLLQRNSKEPNANNTPTAMGEEDPLLALATQLHFALAVNHNASTEHLSILHLCYDLVSSRHGALVSGRGGGGGDNGGKAIIKEDERMIEASQKALRFWTEQLKRVIMIRYGSVGHDIDTVRRLMQHTRTVLRNSNGMELVHHKFI